MSTEQNKALVRRQQDGLWNKGNLDAVEEFYAADVVIHGGVPGTAPGLEGLKQGLATNRAAFPDLQVTTDDMIVEGNKVVNRWTMRGTHKGELMGMPPTGKQVTMEGISIVRIAGGKIVEVWNQADMLGIMQQLGAIPAPEA